MTAAGLYQAALAAIFVCGIASFAVLWCIPAPYGRHGRQGWGPALPARPAWLLMEQPAFWLPLLCFLLGGAERGPAQAAFLAFWLLHYGQRTFLYPFLLPASARPFPALLVLLGALFNTLNGYAIGYGLFQSGAHYPDGWLLSAAFLCGSALFLAGFLANLHSDAVLRRLKAAGGGAYQIPRGGLHRWVSSPNYLGEIAEWAGFAVLSWSLPGLAFAFFTFCNLAPRARVNRRWYRERFPDYPRERKALIPFLW